MSHYITWGASVTTGPFPTPTFFSGTAETMLVTHWYIVHTGIDLENGQTFFGDACANNDIAVRIQVQALGERGAPAVMIMRDATGRTTERTLTR